MKSCQLLISEWKSYKIIVSSSKKHKNTNYNINTYLGSYDAFAVVWARTVSRRISMRVDIEDSR